MYLNLAYFLDKNCSCCDDDSSGRTNQGSNKNKHSSRKGGGGSKHHPHKHPLYTGPLVRSMNQSKIYVKIGDNLSLKIEVCSNPRAHRIFWIAPNFRSLKIGGREKDIKVDNLIAKKVIESTIRVTCVQAELYISEFHWQDEGEYTLIAKNRYGFDGDNIVVKVAGGASERRKQRSKDKERAVSSSRKRNLDQMSSSSINASINIKSSYTAVHMFIVTIIYCFSIPRYRLLFFL